MCDELVELFGEHEASADQERSDAGCLAYSAETGFEPDYFIACGIDRQRAIVTLGPACTSMMAIGIGLCVADDRRPAGNVLLHRREHGVEAAF